MIMRADRHPFPTSSAFTGNSQKQQSLPRSSVGSLLVLGRCDSPKNRCVLFEGYCSVRSCGRYPRALFHFLPWALYFLLSRLFASFPSLFSSTSCNLSLVDCPMMFYRGAPPHPRIGPLVNSCLSHARANIRVGSSFTRI